MTGLLAVQRIGARDSEGARFSSFDADLVQGLNQFLTPKSYSILTTFSRSTKGCVSGCRLFSPPVMLVVYPVIQVKSKNAGFFGILWMRVGVRAGVSLCYFGPVDLRDEATIARAIALICAVFCMIGFASRSAFANDTFPGTTLTGTSGSFTSTNVGATGQTGEPSTFGSNAANAAILNTIWYSWTAPASGTFNVQTCSSTLTNFDTTLNAYTGVAVNALTAITSNDDACVNTTPNAYASSIAFAVTSGTTYRIQLDGYNGLTGNYLFSYSMSPLVTVVNTTNGAEAGPTSGVITVSLSTTSATNTVISYTVGGTATSGSDYTALPLSVTVPAGSTTATINVPVINDAVVEGAETVVVTLTGVTSGTATLGGTLVATNTIADNDVASVSIANTTNGAEAGPVNGVMTLTQTLASATNTVVGYTVSGTATSGVDFTALSGTVTIPAGATTATISIPIINDLVVDSAETVVITLNTITGLATLGTPVSASNTIADNDVASFSIAKSANASAISSPVTLTYTITIANTGNIPLTTPVITDALTQGSSLTLTTGPNLTSGDAAPLGTLNVGETWIYTATYNVTQGNINTGTTISNTATFDTAETPPSTSAAATTSITVTPGMTVVKSANTGGPVAVGNVITYTFRVKNTGNVTLANVNVSDAINGYGTPPVVGNEVLFSDVVPLGDTTDITANNSIWTTLSPGDEINFTGTYTVVQQDVDLLQ